MEDERNTNRDTAVNEKKILKTTRGTAASLPALQIVVAKLAALRAFRDLARQLF